MELYLLFIILLKLSQKTREYENMMFKNLEGLPLEWELVQGQIKNQIHAF